MREALRYDRRVKVPALFAMFAMAGCSLLTVQNPHGTPTECTESIAAPVVDSFAAIAAPYLVYAAVQSNDDATTQTTLTDDQAGKDRFVTALLATPIVLGYVSSAIYGYRSTARCTQIKALSDRPAAPMPPAPPPPPPPAATPLPTAPPLITPPLTAPPLTAPPPTTPLPITAPVTAPTPAPAS